MSGLRDLHLAKLRIRSMKMEFSHFDQEGNAIMVDVSGKDVTLREAVAEGVINMSQECFDLVRSGGMKKGDVLAVARIAGIMGAKKTSELIPLCHILNLTHVAVDFEYLPAVDSAPAGDSVLAAQRPADGSGGTVGGTVGRPGIRAVCAARCTGKTGVEMEALTGVNIALLTIYDMCKAVDRSMEMSDIHLVKKSGGKSGLYIYQNHSASC